MGYDGVSYDCLHLTECHLIETKHEYAFSGTERLDAIEKAAVERAGAESRGRSL